MTKKSTQNNRNEIKNIPSFIIGGRIISIPSELDHGICLELTQREGVYFEEETTRNIISRIYTPENITPFINGERDFRVEIIECLPEEILRHSSSDYGYEELKKSSSGSSSLYKYTGKVHPIPLFRVWSEKVIGNSDSIHIRDFVSELDSSSMLRNILTRYLVHRKINDGDLPATLMALCRR